MTLAALAIGYADGVPRALRRGFSAVLRGRSCPIVGRVSMDSLMIDISSISGTELQPGEFAEIFGETGIDDFAAAGATNSYEILTRIGPRVERRYDGL